MTLVLALFTTLASAQSIPPALWSGFELVGTESLQPFHVSETDAGVRFKEARARFQLGDFPRVRKGLSDDADWLRHEELICISQADARSAARSF